ncbi:bactofilin family protein [Thiohalomonas denitrificans]|uniref:Protein CcmA, bactofilin family n=1 Tax=Thiohalomonas denitrificans TaxID=415747 RepID=A0A1G5PQ60_9GAMM|nr:polymer-forming cytoskeletal protein [Thiohalomonas denitrificans]SCZ51547.1 protein CcmA, bactofilin family [Thiohalomonas denitrificans]
MWGKSTKTNGKTAKIDTLIGQNSEIRGDVVFRGGLHVDGTICGNISADPDSGSVMSLSERGVVEGDIRVPNVVVNGAVIGDVYVTEHIELAAQARITGNVYYKLIEMARGAEVNGSLVHCKDDELASKQPQLEKAEPMLLEENDDS